MLTHRSQVDLNSGIGHSTYYRVIQKSSHGLLVETFQKGLRYFFSVKCFLGVERAIMVDSEFEYNSDVTEYV